MNDVMFKHQALGNPAENIRLIQVKSQPTISPLELSLSTHLVANNVRYFAVSYTWGDSGFTEKLLIDGHSMMVTKNCYYALTQINNRYPSGPNSSEPIYLWIDSICINQDDNQEKGHQVAMMGDIYTKATKVLSCIGPHADNSQMLRAVLNDMKVLDLSAYTDRSTKFPSGWWNLFEKQRWKSIIEDFLHWYPQRLKIPKEIFNVQFRKACLDFANRSYWSRVWIIQEFTATTRSRNDLEILCDSDIFMKTEINLCFYISACLFGQGKSLDVNDGDLYGIVTHCFQVLMRLKASEPVPLGSVLFDTRNLFHCARPEDRVYGMLPLVKWPEGFSPIQPVYKPSSTLDLAEMLIKMTHFAPWKYETILAGLEIYHDHKLLRPLIEARIHDPQRFSGRHGVSTIRSSEKFETGVLTISSNNANQLSTTLVRTDYNGRGLIEEEGELLQNAGGILDRPQLLFAGSDLAGILCSEAQEGDVIIKPETQSILVLRPRTDVGQYDVIGQGLLSSRYEFPDNLPPSLGLLEQRLEDHEARRPYTHLAEGRNSWKVEIYKSKKVSLEQEIGNVSRLGQIGNLRRSIELRAEPIEWVMFVGQDFTKDSQPNTQRVLERLYTRINLEATIV